MAIEGQEAEDIDGTTHGGVAGEPARASVRGASSAGCVVAGDFSSEDDAARRGEGAEGEESGGKQKLHLV